MTPKTYNLVAAQGDEYEDHVCDIAADYGTYAYYCQITNKSEGIDLRVRLNGDDDACFTLSGNATQIFQRGDILVSKLEFANVDSSSGGNIPVEVIIGVSL